MAQKSDTYYSYDHKLINRDFEDKKNYKVKKTPNTFANYKSSDGGQTSQLG